MEACQSSYLNPQPVPPRTIAASRIAPATEPIMILVPLGPVGVKERATQSASNIKNICCCMISHRGSQQSSRVSVITFVFLGALWWRGDGDGVKHAAVLPGVVGITDTLHLITASLRRFKGSALKTWSHDCVRTTTANETSSPRDGSRCVRTWSRGRCWGWRWWQGGSGAPGTSCLAHTVSRPQRTRRPTRHRALRGLPFCQMDNDFISV